MNTMANMKTGPQKKEDDLAKSLYDYLDIDGRIESLLEPDSYYEQHQTPLKSAKILKAQHKQEIKDQLFPADQPERYTSAMLYINQALPQKFSGEELENFQNELYNSTNHALQFVIQRLENPQENSNVQEGIIFPQEIYGFSTATIQAFYAIGNDCVDQKKVKEAENIFCYLCYLAPYLGNNWAMLGYCSQLKDANKDAMQIYEIAHEIDPQNIMAAAFLCNCCIENHEIDRAKEVLYELQQLVNQSPETTERWATVLENIENTLNYKRL